MLGVTRPTLSVSGLAPEGNGKKHAVDVMAVIGIAPAKHVSTSKQLSGAPQRAAEEIARALELAEVLDHPSSLSHAVLNAAMALQILGDRDATRQMAERAIAIAERTGSARYAEWWWHRRVT